MRKLSFIAVSALLVLGIASCKKNSDVQNSESKKAMVKTEFIELPTTGEAERTGGTKVKWVQLWAGGPKWAEYNVGSDVRQDYDAYYTWGGKGKHGKEIIWSDDHDRRAQTLSGDNDTATMLWGDNWRMPTDEEFLALLDNCEWLWTDNYNNTGRKGGIYKGKEPGFTENSVFFPAAGFCYYGEVLNVGSSGYYWSSTGSSRDYAYDMSFDSYSPKVSHFNRSYGNSVRAVLREE